MLQISSRRCSRTHGFTLVELMVSITIVVILAALVFALSRRASESAKIAANMSNLRNLGPIITTITQDQGSYPPGWSWPKGKSWADEVVEALHDGNQLQDAILLSPLVASDIPPDFKHPTVSNYSVSPFIFTPEYPSGQGYKVTPARLRRPAEQILLGDGLPRAEDAPYGFSMIVWWDLINSGRAGNSGNPPISNQTRARRALSWPGGIEEMKDDGGKGLPAFRNRGSAHFLFADGHVEGLAPGELEYRHFAISY